MLDAATYLNQLEHDAARRELTRCCGSGRWVTAMLSNRPFASTTSLRQRAREIWTGLSGEDYREAFALHPEIGADLDKLREKFRSKRALGSASDESTSLVWSNGEQAGVNGASEATLQALRDANLAYKRRFGFIFIVCATGKTAEQMLAMLLSRMSNGPEQELQVAAQEHAKITELRLEKLGS
jgi:2-oxo-4-hydroxy-4-carboxy-5-ureidoimidazoline decarboxylase